MNQSLIVKPYLSKASIDLEDSRRLLDAALALERGNRSEAARRLGISLRTVQRHLAEAPRQRLV